MKYYLLPALILFVLAAANAQPKPVDVFPLKNYTLKNAGDIPPGFNCLLISNKAQFEKTFYIEPKLMNDTLAPHFWREYVLAVAVSPSYKEIKVSIDRAEQEGHILNVYCSSTKGEERDYMTSALALVTIERNKNIKTIRFYKGKMPLMTLGVVK